MTKADEKPMNQAPAGGDGAESTKPDSLPPTAALEAAARADLDETESLLAGFDRAPRRPRREGERDSQKDFVAHFSGRKELQPEAASPQPKDPARNAPTVIVPREHGKRPAAVWAVVVVAMLLVGWLAATAIIRAVAPKHEATEAPTVATTTVSMATAAPPTTRADAIPAPEPSAPVATDEPAPPLGPTAATTRPPEPSPKTAPSGPSTAATASVAPPAAAQTDVTRPAAPRASASHGYIREL